MTVLMHDCRAKMGDIPMELEELLYADDILLIGREPAELQRYMDCIATEGRRYGLQLNNSKLEMLQIHSNATIMDPDGNPVKCKASLKYLGAVLQNTGRIDPEIGSKLGMTRQDFRRLIQIWQYANIAKRWKI